MGDRRPDRSMTAALTELSESVTFNFPIATKAEFVEQMLTHGSAIEFAGQTYDTRYSANLIPGFLFPVENMADLVSKVLELLESRGLIDEGASYAP